MQSSKSLHLGGRHHKKSYSSDMLASNSKKKFISIVSSGLKRIENNDNNPACLRGVAELKEAAMGVRTHKRRDSRGITLRIKQSNMPQHQGQQSHQSVGVKDRMRAFKQRLSNLHDPSTATLQSMVATPPIGTPINRLLFESECKENY